MKKTCTKCHKEYPTTAEYFHRDKYAKSGLRPDCKQCKADYAQSAAGKKVFRKSGLKRLYGLTPAQHAWMYIDQDGCCAICERPIEYSEVHTDHDHKTGKVRGLLCQRCNIGLAAVENMEYRQAALRYLGVKG